MRYGIALLAVCFLAACANRGAVPALTLTAPAAVSLGIPVQSGSDDVPLDQAIAGIAAHTISDKKKGIIFALISRSDEACEKYMADAIVQANGSSSVLNVSSLALTGLAGTLKPLNTAQALAAGATFATGTETYLSTKVLGGNAPALIYKSVMAERTRERSRMTQLMGLGADPLMIAADVQNYHNMCGVTVGINALNTAVTEAEAGAESAGAEKAAIERAYFQKSQNDLRALTTAQ